MVYASRASATSLDVLTAIALQVFLTERLTMRPMRLLFETQLAAQEVAFMLRCEYDGCNMITLPPLYDALALRTAIELTGADFCFDGDHYPLVLPLLDENLRTLVDESSVNETYYKPELWSDRTLF